MWRLSLGIALAVALGAQEDAASLLEQKCLHCHGGMQLGKLDLRTRESAMRGGEHGASIVPGAAATSKLIRMVSGLDTPRMPLGGTLAAGEIEVLRQWITAGAKYPDRTLVAQQKSGFTPEPPLREGDRKWWAFQPVRTVGGTIDTLLNEPMAKASVKPAPRAGRATLVRRAYLDLEQRPAGLAETHRPPARVAALRRALGPPLARRRAVRRFKRLRARFRPAQRLAVPGLCHPGLQ